MGDKPENEPENKPDTGNQNPPANDSGTDWEAEAKKWKGLARKHEDQSKANAKELAELKSAGDASKSQLEKLTEAVTAMQKRAEDAEAKALRAEVAQVKGLTPAQAARLVGSTREELETDADELLEVFKPAKDDTSGGGKGGKPTERLKPGASSDAEPDVDIQEMVAKIPR